MPVSDRDIALRLEIRSFDTTTREGRMPDDPAGAAVERPFQPEIPRSRFAQGMVPSERYPMNLHLGRFSEGIETIPDPPQRDHRGRFSQGQEQLPNDPRKHIRRRYSEGLEHH
jgi:hypothetical protein